MRRRQLDSGDSVTLFPFLAVLICTMGSLIVLLVVVVQQARASADTASVAVAEAIAEFEEHRTDLVQSKETLQWKIELLEDSRDRTEEELTRRRNELSHLEDHIRTLAEQLRDLKQKALSIVAESDTTNQDESDLNSQIEDLDEQLEIAEAEYAAALAEYKTKEKSYAIVAYTGSNGTERRPVFVECLADKILLQPEGIELTGEDFREPITNDNPLAMALRAKREYLSKAAHSEDDGEPYPLLVVRPSGSQAYAAARAAMRAWDSEFGYELVPDDLELSYPDVDPAIAEVVEAAVREARQRRQELMSMAPRRFGRMASSSRTLRPSRNGGFAPTGDARGNSSYNNGSDTGFGGFGSGDGPGGFGPENNEFNQAGLGQPNGTQNQTSGDRGSFGRYPEGEANTTNRSHAATEQFAANGHGGQSGSMRFRNSGESGGTAGTSSTGTNGSGTNSGAGTQSSQSGPSGSGQRGTGGSTGGGSDGPRGAAGGFGGVSGAGGQAGGSGSLANARGRDWGLPSRVSGGTGITRPLAMTCYADRIVLHSDRGARKRSEEFPIETNVRGEVDKVVSAIWRRIDEWGIAGTGMYWKPVLNVRVAVDGEQVFVELQTLLDRSGITVSRRK